MENIYFLIKRLVYFPIEAAEAIALYGGQVTGECSLKSHGVKISLGSILSIAPKPSCPKSHKSKFNFLAIY